MVVGSLGKPFGLGQLKVVAESVSGPASYPSGGFSVAFDELRQVHAAIVIAGGGYLAEVAGVSGNTVTIVVRYFDYDAAADGVAIEIPAGTDLSAVSFWVIAIGE